ncbi:hypothetical protein CJ301_18045 [Limimaricola cinnabarinus]|uniref:Peptidase M41 domain-containing protein n=2 Tax=Limimaricola cinnabarinus TaxID=1125964 RepID=A0A2G1MBT9_9RHOB|nr:hypothetical protein CJ301_18045 [Limimaricola cinnabarinus]
MDLRVLIERAGTRVFFGRGSALRRPGRLGRVLELPLPRPVQIAGMLHHHLGRDLADLDLLPLARRATGLSAADIAALIRQARSAARADRRAIDDRDLQRALDGLRPQGCAPHRRRIAIHEAGHALAHHLLGITRPTAMRLTVDGGMVEVEPLIEPQTLAQFEARLQTLLAGRAAERLLFGDVSAGAAAVKRATWPWRRKPRFGSRPCSAWAARGRSGSRHRPRLFRSTAPFGAGPGAAGDGRGRDHMLARAASGPAAAPRREADDREGH